MHYDFRKLKEAILFNTVETLPTDHTQLDEELKILIEEANKNGQQIRHYIGFEVSGQIHFPGSVYQMLNVAKLQAAGVECIIWLADYHTWINKKLDGNIETIRRVANEYFEPVFKKCLEVVGGDSAKLKFLYAKDEYFKKNDRELSFWDYEFEVEKNITLSRILRSLSIAGKEGGENVDYQVTRYPGMQAADVFWLKTHIIQAGLDQRKIYVLTRDNATKLEPEFQLHIGEKKVKPVVFFNQLLLGLDRPTTEVSTNLSSGERIMTDYSSSRDLEDNFAQVRTEQALSSEETNTNALFEGAKMSKSKPDSAIWVHDSHDEIQRKLKKAYCPMVDNSKSVEENEHIQQFNPLLDWSKKMIFPAGKHVFVSRPEKFGGDKEYFSFEELKADYFAGNLHPLDLKSGVAKTLATWFEPIIKYVEGNPSGLELVKSAKNS